jgi:ATP-binding cassette subfamily B (MDR/TAP) protein 1
MSSSNHQEISLNEDDVKEKTSKNLLRSCFHTPFFIKLLKLNSPEKFYLIVGSVCALLYGAVEPAVGLVYSMVYGLLANPNVDIQSSRTRDLSLGIFGIYVLAGIVQFLSTVTFAKAGEALTLRMRLFTFEAMLRREISWFDDEKNSVGSLVTRLSNDTAALKVN